MEEGGADVVQMTQESEEATLLLVVPHLYTVPCIYVYMFMTYSVHSKQQPTEDSLYITRIWSKLTLKDNHKPYVNTIKKLHTVHVHCMYMYNVVHFVTMCTMYMYIYMYMYMHVYM